MATNINTLLIVLGLFLFSACQNNSEFAPSGYGDWIMNPSNGLMKSKQIGDIRVDVLFKPVDYLLMTDLKNGTIEDGELEDRKKQLNGMYYFDCRLTVIQNNKTINIVNYTAQTDEQLAQRDYYFSYKLKDDIKLKINDSDMPCKLYHFERSYDLAPHRTALLGFEKEIDETTEITLNIQSPFLGTGPLKFKFSKEDLSNIPYLKI